MIAVLAFSTHQNSKKKKKVMDGLKMVRHFLALALAMSVASQPLDTIATSGAANLSTQLLNTTTTTNFTLPEESKEDNVSMFKELGRLFLALAWMSVASQPLDNIATSGAATLPTQLLNTTTTIPRILVVTGRGSRSQKKTEVWPKPESQCALPDFPLEVGGTVGFWTAQGPMVCGGFGEKNASFTRSFNGHGSGEQSINTFGLFTG